MATRVSWLNSAVSRSAGRRRRRPTGRVDCRVAIRRHSSRWPGPTRSSGEPYIGIVIAFLGVFHGQFHDMVVAVRASRAPPTSRTIFSRRKDGLWAQFASVILTARQIMVDDFGNIVDSKMQRNLRGAAAKGFTQSWA